MCIYIYTCYIISMALPPFLPHPSLGVGGALATVAGWLGWRHLPCSLKNTKTITYNRFNFGVYILYKFEVFYITL